MGGKTGRPSGYSTEIAEVICQRLSEGESLRQICRNEDMPGKSSVMRWLDEREDFREQYARAHLLQADHFADEILEIADDGSNDWIERETRSGNTIESADHEHINRSRLRVDARKWLMARMAPKKYGDKVGLEHSGPEGGELQVRWLKDGA